jgi:hypothetical protein
MSQTYQQYKQTDARLAQKTNLEAQSASYLLNAQTRTSINIMLISCSTVNMDDEPVRTPSSEQIGINTLQLAQQLYPHLDIQTKTFKLREIDFAHCEANYSISGHYCTRPCRISQRLAQLGKADPLTDLYYSLVDRCDIVLIATPIRRGNPSSLHQKLIERLNCIQTQNETYGVDLIHNQLAGFIIVGAQDGVQAVMGNMFSFRAQTGFAFAKDPFV